MPNKEIERAGKALRNGGVAVFPTETVYGIGVRFDEEIPYKTLVDLKKRPPEKPFSIMFSSLIDALNWIEVDIDRLRLMERFLPGEVTFLVKARGNIPHQADLGTGIVGIRVPSGSVARAVLSEAGLPCLVTSANPAGMPPAKTLEEAKAYFPNGVDAFVGGECESLVPTTIVDLTGTQPKIVREGKITPTDIMNAWRS